MDYLVNVEKKTARQAALDWMAAHRELVADWFR
jgi:ABC-type proline/glycine betaine transport system substrate-binding protein